MKWIRPYDEVIETRELHHLCSNCGRYCFYTFYENEDILTPYCPWCGEKSEEE